MQYLSRDQILGAEDQQFVDVAVPEWKGKVRIAALTAGQRDALEAALLDSTKKGASVIPQYRAKIVAMCCVDRDGKRIFTEADIPKLEERNAASVERIVRACNKLNVISESELEELTKNSVPGTADSSSST